MFFDRGPASTEQFHDNKSDRMHIFGLSPSSTPMSNATIEGSHPRDWKLYGKQFFVESSSTAPELIKRELRRAIMDNQTFDVSNRKIDGRTFGTPNEIWSYATRKSRDLADQVAFDTAVRSYLTKKDFAIKADGLYLHG